ncbi:hypothetical protein ABB37_04722 [Leptomonas pyrrhocoris]|uniref:Uncharacterized protein n=1 Tax=Leptomonas pyrrhocoris TaxID=157538 RepID=A0A0M9G1X9_LEPPY|nr:hypothetical protein ABB37_04722 [Leptomonas pyrrhocoris]KPA80506.1 hypothetical protein ABB37_04722 [Leptomonas pyrrhocoris]|eukprot:XP_015658945.1 hypothetical protein ABB37_04722 [Leptomonas pyrrhocoris]
MPNLINEPDADQHDATHRPSLPLHPQRSAPRRSRVPTTATLRPDWRVKVENERVTAATTVSATTDNTVDSNEVRRRPCCTHRGNWHDDSLIEKKTQDTAETAKRLPRFPSLLAQKLNATITAAQDGDSLNALTLSTQLNTEDTQEDTAAQAAATLSTMRDGHQRMHCAQPTEDTVMVPAPTAEALKDPATPTMLRHAALPCLRTQLRGSFTANTSTTGAATGSNNRVEVMTAATPEERHEVDAAAGAPSAATSPVVTSTALRGVVIIVPSPPHEERPPNVAAARRSYSLNGSSNASEVWMALSGSACNSLDVGHQSASPSHLSQSRPRGRRRNSEAMSDSLPRVATGTCGNGSVGAHCGHSLLLDATQLKARYFPASSSTFTATTALARAARCCTDTHRPVTTDTCNASGQGVAQAAHGRLPPPPPSPGAATTSHKSTAAIPVSGREEEDASHAASAHSGYNSNNESSPCRSAESSLMTDLSGMACCDIEGTPLHHPAMRRQRSVVINGGGNASAPRHSSVAVVNLSSMTPSALMRATTATPLVNFTTHTASTTATASAAAVSSVVRSAMHVVVARHEVDDGAATSSAEGRPTTSMEALLLDDPDAPPGATAAALRHLRERKLSRKKNRRPLRRNPTAATSSHCGCAHSHANAAEFAMSLVVSTGAVESCRRHNRPLANSSVLPVSPQSTALVSRHCSNEDARRGLEKTIHPCAFGAHPLHPLEPGPLPLSNAGVVPLVAMEIHLPKVTRRVKRSSRK